MADTKWCPSDPPALNAPSVPADLPKDLAADALPFLVAHALQAAAIAILPDDHVDGGAEWGPPTVDASCCCGQIKTGIVTPAFFGESPCFLLPDYEWVVLVTWDKKCSTLETASAEARRLTRLLPGVAQSMAGQALRRKITLESSSNLADGDGCPNLTLIARVT